MENLKHVAIVNKGRKVITAWRRTHPNEALDLSHANLRRVDLRDADLRDANFSRADLRGADLSHANLRGANLSRAYLIEANLSRTNFIEANLSHACLIEANLSRADLSRADLSRADLSRADLRMARLIEACLDAATLTGACLWEAQRAGWSIKDIRCDTIYWDYEYQPPTGYAPGEFERLFSEKTKIVLHYTKGISPIEIATLPALIQRLQDQHPGCTLRLHAVEDAPGGSNVILAIDDPGNRTLDQIGPLGVIVGKFTLSFRDEVCVPRQMQSRMSGQAVTSPNDAMRYDSEQSKTST